MKKIFKILPIIAAIMAVAMMISVTASAASVVKPRYSETSYMSMDLTFESGTAHCGVTMRTNNTNIPIVNGKVTLEDSSGNVLATWDNLYASDGYLNFYEMYSPVTKGESYTMTITATVVGKTRVEYISEPFTRTYK